MTTPMYGGGEDLLQINGEHRQSQGVLGQSRVVDKILSHVCNAKTLQHSTLRGAAGHCGWFREAAGGRPQWAPPPKASVGHKWVGGDR